MLAILVAFDRALGALERFICVTALAIIVIAISAGVIFRYGLNSPLMWSNDTGTLCLMWLTFIGASMVMKGEGHIAIDVLMRALPSMGRKILAGVLLLLMAGALVAVCIAMFAILPVQNKTLIDALNISRAAYGVPVLWMCASMLIHIASRLLSGRLEPE